MFTVVYKTKTNQMYSFVAPVATRQEAVSDFSCFFNYQKDLTLVAVTPKV
jgi:hypothetical protein